MIGRPNANRLYAGAGFMLVLLLTLPGAVQANMDRWEIDQEHFAVGFLVDHIGFARVLGLFLHAEGHFFFNPETLEIGGGEWIIHTDSVFTNHSERDEHLLGSDFLDAERYPRMVFVPQIWEATGEGQGRLHGTLELLGQIRPVTFDARINKIGRYPIPLGGLFSRPQVLGASLRGTISRSEWGMTYGVSRGLVGDEIELILEFEAQRR